MTASNGRPAPTEAGPRDTSRGSGPAEADPTAPSGTTEPSPATGPAPAGRAHVPAEPPAPSDAAPVTADPAPAGGAHVPAEPPAPVGPAAAPAAPVPSAAASAPAAPTSRAGAAARDDTVAGVVRQWRAVHPDLDTAPMEIIGRINRCAALLQQAEDAPLRRAGLSRPEFDLLGALRRTGHELTPSELARETFSSGAAVTKRLKQLTERGLVERRGDTRDRRVAHLRLTDAGRDLVDGLLPDQLAYERTVLGALDGDGRGELAELLGELLTRLEGRPGVPGV